MQSVQIDQKSAQTALVRSVLMGALSKEVIVGPFVVAFAVQVLGFSTGQLSWFLSIIPLVVLLRYPFLDAIRGQPRVTVTLWARYLQLTCLILLCALPQSVLTLPVLMAIAVLFTFANEFLQNAVWTNLVTEVTTTADRGRFLGRLRTWKQASALCFALIGLMIVGDTLSHGEYRVLLAIVMVLCLNSIFWFRQVPRTQPVERRSGRGRFRELVRTSPLMRVPLALKLVVAGVHWPILVVYLIGTLHLPANLIMLNAIMMMLGPMFSQVFWGRKADEDGFRKLYLMYFSAAWCVFPILLFVPDFALVPQGGLHWTLGFCAMLLFSLLNGILIAGQMMAGSMYHAQYVSEPGGFHAFNILTALGHLWNGALTAVGGLLLVWLGGAGPQHQFGLIWLDPFRVLLLCVVAVLLLLGYAIARGITENRPAAA